MIIDFGSERGGVRQYRELREFTAEMRNEGREWLNAGAVTTSNALVAVASELSARLIAFSGEVQAHVSDGDELVPIRIAAARERFSPILAGSPHGHELLEAIASADLAGAQRVLAGASRARAQTRVGAGGRAAGFESPVQLRIIPESPAPSAPPAVTPAAVSDEVAKMLERMRDHVAKMERLQSSTQRQRDEVVAAVEQIERSREEFSEEIQRKLDWEKASQETATQPAPAPAADIWTSRSRVHWRRQRKLASATILTAVGTAVATSLVSVILFYFSFSVIGVPQVGYPITQLVFCALVTLSIAAPGLFFVHSLSALMAKEYSLACASENRRALVEMYLSLTQDSEERRSSEFSALFGPLS